MSDNVTHPSHYTEGAPTHSRCGEPIETIEVTQALNFNRGNVVKYTLRAGKKGGPEKEIEDLEKARQYIDFEIDRVKSEKAREEEKRPDPAAVGLSSEFLGRLEFVLRQGAK